MLQQETEEPGTSGMRCSSKGAQELLPLEVHVPAQDRSSYYRTRQPATYDVSSRTGCHPEKPTATPLPSIFDILNKLKYLVDLSTFPYY